MGEDIQCFDNEQLINLIENMPEDCDGIVYNGEKISLSNDYKVAIAKSEEEKQIVKVNIWNLKTEEELFIKAHVINGTVISISTYEEND